MKALSKQKEISRGHGETLEIVGGQLSNWMQQTQSKSKSLAISLKQRQSNHNAPFEKLTYRIHSSCKYVCLQLFFSLAFTQLPSKRYNKAALM
jgi:hypothetical protein